MIRANQDIRDTAKRNGVYLWQIAEQINLNDNYFSRKLRHELSPEEKTRILSIIEELGKGKK